MKKTFGERVNSFLKSLGGESKDEEKEEEGLDNPDSDQGGDDGEGDGDGEGTMEKSDLADATEILVDLVRELKGVNKSLSALTKRQDGIEKAQEDIGEAVVGVAEIVSKIANSPMPQKSVMGKSLDGGGDAGASGGVITQVEFEKAQRVLVKACSEKRISLFQSSMMEHDLQKAMTIPGYQMKPEYRDFISKEIKG